MSSIISFFEEDKNEDLYVFLNDNNLILVTNEKKCTVSLSSSEIEKVGLLLDVYIKKYNNLYVWDLKNIISFFYKNFDFQIDFPNKVYDLLIISSYFCVNINKNCNILPIKNFIENLEKTSSWDFFKKLYFDIYVPLMLEILPSIEKRFLIDYKNKKKIYCYYELEGQINGRMKNLKLSDDYYLPHNLRDEEKENIKLPNEQDCFMYFDYKHMEVSVLQWITQDSNLDKIINSEDLYKSIWRGIFHSEPDDNQRRLCKKIFLPVVFGQGYKSLSSHIGISEKNAKKLIYKLECAFPVAFNWVKSQQVDSNNFSSDIFFRRRKFDESELYKIRNFCIQSPSSMICLRKLVKLHELSKNNLFNIVFHVHDGYVICCDKKQISFIFNKVKQVLEEDDDMFPKLKLKVVGSYGEKLNKLKIIGEK